MTEKTLNTKAELAKEIALIKQQGWALLDQELEDGVRSIAAPIRDKHGRTIAAINIGTQTGRTKMSQLKDDYLPRLLQAANQITSAMAKRWFLERTIGTKTNQSWHSEGFSVTLNFN